MESYLAQFFDYQNIFGSMCSSNGLLPKLQSLFCAFIRKIKVITLCDEVSLTLQEVNEVQEKWAKMRLELKQPKFLGWLSALIFESTIQYIVKGPLYECI